MVARFYLNDVSGDVRIGPNPFLLVVHRVELQGGAENNNEIEMIEIFSLE